MFLLLLSLSFVSCKQKVKDATPTISVSIEPQRYFAEKIVGDKWKVNTIVSKGSSPEFFDPTPAQIVDFGKSCAYFMIGLFPFEKKLTAMLEQNNPNILFVNCSEGIEASEHNHTHEGETHLGQDPHVWCSPRTAAILSRNIYEGMLKLDPANKPYYEQNYQALQREIEEVDSLVGQRLEKAKVRSFLIFHPALTYFADAYGLKQYSIENEGKSPSPAMMSDLVNTAKEQGIKLVFIQPEYDKKNAENLAGEIDGRVVGINPLAYDWKEEMLKIAKSMEEQ